MNTINQVSVKEGIKEKHLFFNRSSVQNIINILQNQPVVAEESSTDKYGASKRQRGFVGYLISKASNDVLAKLDAYIKAHGVVETESYKNYMDWKAKNEKKQTYTDKSGAKKTAKPVRTKITAQKVSDAVSVLRTVASRAKSQEQQLALISKIAEITGSIPIKK